MSTIPPDVRSNIAHLPNAWVATGYIWAWLLTQPAGQTLGPSLPQTLRELFDHSYVPTQIEQALFALTVADEVYDLLHQQPMVDIMIDYPPIISEILNMAADRAGIESQLLGWPAKTRTWTSHRQISLCWGDGCQLHQGLIWTMSDALQSQEED